MIHFSNVSKTYNPGLFKKKVQAVSELELEVEQGEVFGLIGPNGAGKSSSIRMLLGLSRPSAGKVLFQGQSLDGTSFQSEIGYLPENPYLYDYLSLEELLRFCGRASGMSDNEIRLRIQELLAKLDLQDVQKRPLRTFSKGMLQRAGICFALLHDPSVVILDEPMSGLDPIGRKMVFDLVMELKERGKTIFFCSHILNDVERLCDRIGLMNKGRLVKQFSRNDLLQYDGKAVFLLVRTLSPAERDAIQNFGGAVREEKAGHLLAVPDESYHSINSYLEESGIRVLGGRSEWMSLEELFMQTVKEQAQ